MEPFLLKFIHSFCYEELFVTYTEYLSFMLLMFDVDLYLQPFFENCILMNGVLKCTTKQITLIFSDLR